jgi:pimeloyl-ACP methyl ester carboxylesterase
MTGVARGILPAYFADYWGREGEFASFHAAVSATHISALDDNLVRHIIDDSEDLGSLTVPALVVVGRHDFICGVRWAQELHASSQRRLAPRSDSIQPVGDPALSAARASEGRARQTSRSWTGPDHRRRPHRLGNAVAGSP